MESRRKSRPAHQIMISRMGDVIETAAVPAAVDEQDKAWRNYHALMRCTDRRNPVPTVVDQLGAWLREKKIDVDLRHDNDFTDVERSFEIRYHERDHSYDVRAFLVEASPIGEWRSEIVASPDGWVEIVVTNSQGRFVKVPRIAKYLMQALPLGDAGLSFVDHAEIWDVHQAPRLVDLLTEPLRHAPVFVAAMGDDADLAQPFTTKVNTWLGETYGLTQAIILTPNARRAAADLLQAHAVQPWSIRTYLPSVGLGNRWDAVRHRYLQTVTLAKRPDVQIIALLGGIARGQTAERPTSPEVARVHRAFQRLADQELTRALHVSAFLPVPGDVAQSTRVSDAVDAQAHPASSELAAAPAEAPPPIASDELTAESALVGTLQEQLDLVRTILGIGEITREALHSLVDAANAVQANPAAVERMGERLAQLRHEIAERELAIEGLREAVMDHEINTAIAEEASSKAVSEALWLRQQLSARGNYETAHAVAPDFICPEDMSSLVETLPEGIEFTGSIKDLDEVDERDSLKACVRVAWDAVCSMADYLKAKREDLVDGSFHEYVKNTPPGYHGMAPAKSAENETSVTKDRFGEQRVFRVPTDVHPEGVVTMNAHIKLGRIGMASPRMHYFHDPKSGRILIGYIGLHLPNTMSN